MVILLDIDGVLVIEPAWRKVESEADGFTRFDKQSANNLAHILAETNAAVVLTTTHRINFTNQQWFEIFKLRGIAINSISKLNNKLSLAELGERGKEIEVWAKDNCDENFVILDDDPSINQLPEWITQRWVTIKPFKGIDDEAKQKTLSILLDR
ncbi:HAD domain-containing protein [Mucilaginibacter kameinonensis]|uniref:HAD domain-containing protein n=1 Tax=Mucilaginibacter kameinonensis TaxID=452286 RepID=UPI000EF7F3AB|nr:HAD domain-containing protein [Mucilaginibacter kameinonensis]